VPRPDIHFQPTAASVWVCFEALPGLTALPGTWRTSLGEAFEPVRALVLQQSASPAQLVPCPRGCGLAHEVVRHPDGTLAAVCGGDPGGEIPLSPEDVVPLEMSWSRLGHVLCEALGLHGKAAILPPPNTRQIGAWSAAAVPAVLTIQCCRTAFRRVVAELVTRLQGPFILLAPTSDHFDAPCQELLAYARAAFFPLETTVFLDRNGFLRPVKRPGELFAPFTPQPGETEKEVARRAFELVRTLDSERPLKPPSLLTVFRLYCLQELSAAAIASRFDCSKATVISRLNLIRQQTGAEPLNLRRVCVWLDRVAEGASDPRAVRISRRLLAQDGPQHPHF
jgi:hypothetical protein